MSSKSTTSTTTPKKARTLRDYTVRAFGYDITIPAGSVVSNKSALGYDDSTRFWEDFHAVAERLTGFKDSTLAHDLTHRGIDVPEEYCAPYSIPVEKTAEYPTRYAAFERNGVLFVHDSPKMSGGHEWAVFHDETNAARQVHGEIISYQDKGLLLEVSTGPRVGMWRTVFSHRMPYNYDRAQALLISELQKALNA